MSTVNHAACGAACDTCSSLHLQHEVLTAEKHKHCVGNVALHVLAKGVDMFSER